MRPAPRPSTYHDDYWLYADGPDHDAPPAPGKWMVFVYPDDVDRYWELVSHAVEHGTLGPSAKVATAKINPNASNPRTRLICVYTADWRDRDDVARVLGALRDLGISWRLSYKTDDATLEGKYGRGSSRYISPLGSGTSHERA